MEVFVDGIGLRAPGLDGWSASREALAGDMAYTPSPLLLSGSGRLPPAERRRAILAVKIAMAVGEEAIAHAEIDASGIPTVFTSSGGDGETIGQILEALATPEREVSPTKFHNCVHNAPAGYWSIASRSHERSTNLACFDFSFAAGLLEAATQARVDGVRVLLVSHDSPHTPPVHATRPIMGAFGVALVLAPRPSNRSIARMSVEVTRQAGPLSSMPQAALETLRCSNPAARSLPMLAALARNAEEKVIVEHVGGNRMVVSVKPC